MINLPKMIANGEEPENRLHAQKAVIVKLMEK